MQENIIIADTSCLILFEKLDMLPVLKQLFGSITITKIVAKEFGKNIPEWIHIVNPKDKISTKILESSLDKGEASSIALSLEWKQSLLIIDEVKGRKVAKQLGIHITGTFGILILAKNEKIIPHIKPILEKIRMTNFRFSKELETTVLRLAGE